MSEYLIQEETLRGIADSIRAKTGKTDPMGAEQMATEIDSISAGGGGGESAELLDKVIDRSITEITSNVTSVGKYAFHSCIGLSNVNLPSATKVGNYAFSNCTGLGNVSIPNLTSLGSNAFYHCIYLKSVDFPLLTTVKSSAFRESNLREGVNLPSLTTIETYGFASSGIKTADFPSVTNIGNNAFVSCSALTSVSLPLITSVPTYAFGYNAKLTNVNIPLATKLESNAFIQCTALTSVDFPNVTSLGSSAFSSCKALTSANFPNATSLGSGAFYGDYPLTKVILGTKNTTVATLANINAFTDCYHILGTVNADYNPNGLKDGYIYVPLSLVDDYRVKTNWVTYASQIMPWVATVEELANIDGTTYDHACVGEGVDSVEYVYNGTTWEVFIR